MKSISLYNDYNGVISGNIYVNITSQSYSLVDIYAISGKQKGPNEK